MSRSNRAAMVALASFAGIALANDPRVQYRVIALSGDQAPGLAAGVLLDTLDFSPLIDESGRVAFYANFNGPGIDGDNDEALWIDLGAGPILALRQGDHAPSLPDEYVFSSTWGHIKSFKTATIFVETNPVPDTFQGFLTDGVYIATTGEESVLARGGQQAPGLDPGVRFVSPLTDNPNAGAHSAFSALVTGPGIDASNDETIHAGGPGNLRLIAWEGQPDPAGDIYDSFFLFPPRANASGDILFTASVIVGGEVHLDAYYVAGAEGVTRIAVEGDPVIGGPDGSTIRSISPNGAGFNRHGHAAIPVTLQGPGIVPGVNDRAILLARGRGLEVLVQAGDPVPSIPDATIKNWILVAAFTLSDADETLLSITLQGSGIDTSNNTAIVRVGPETLALLARRGDQVPGLSPGLEFKNLDAFPVMGPAGHAAFVGTTSDNVHNFFGANLLGESFILSRAGDPFTLPDQRILTINSETHLDYPFGGDDQRASCVSADGQVAFSLYFRERGTAIVAARIPPCRADVTGEGELNIFDFLAFQTLFAEDSPLADFNADGVLDLFDFLAFQAGFGHGC